MKTVTLWFTAVWRVLFFANLVITFLILYPVFYILLKREGWFPYAFTWKKIWARLILHDVGLFYKVRYIARLDRNTAYVFCPNHTSYLDIMLSYLVIPQYFSFVGKAALVKIPLFGRFFTSKMDIAIERDSPTASFKAMQVAGSYIDRGISINIFPEGTISPDVPRLLPYKNGPFKLAISKAAPVVPVTFHDNWKHLPYEGNHKGGGPGTVHVTVHEPIPTKGMTDADVGRLRQMVREVIERELNIKYL